MQPMNIESNKFISNLVEENFDIAIPVKGKGLIDAKRFKKLNSLN